MKCGVCITSIGEEWGDKRLKDLGTVYVAGDKKTKGDWKDVKYLSPEEQQDRWPKLSNAIGWNKYGRKNFAYLAALEDGCDAILETDDDNFLSVSGLKTVMQRMNFPKKETAYFEVIKHGTGWFNIPSLFTFPIFRPRGWPIHHKIPHGSGRLPQLETEQMLPPHVTQFGVSGEPDCDAIQRLITPMMSVYPKAHEPVVMKPQRGVHCPWNTQATLWTGDFEWMFIPGNWPDRCIDIVRGYLYPNPVLWDNVGFHQERNFHRVEYDFRMEHLLREHCQELVSLNSSNVDEAWLLAAKYSRTSNEPTGEWLECLSKIS